ncbi:adenylate/guanylate cyclase domain-containing protein [Leptospira noumeaensis]|nr:adenylate/guanylate cyclase domain-containing protein [Leptospira noumeaensis]
MEEESNSSDSNEHLIPDKQNDSIDENSSDTLPGSALNFPKQINTINNMSSLSAAQSVAEALKRTNALNSMSSLSAAQSVAEALKRTNALNSMSREHQMQENVIQENYSSSLKLKKDIIELEKQILEFENKYSEKSEEHKEATEELEKLKVLIETYDSKSKLNHIASKIHPEAANLLYSNHDLLQEFDKDTSRNVTVLSIDIRRSTELMLKAKDPHSYALFISEIAVGLKEIILANFGIFDKFTGDGILAFFSEFYSGKDFLAHSLKAANECHEFFNKYYNLNRNKFKIVMKDIGLGIGIDYGEANIIKINNELTVIGNPVVYACRFSGCQPNQTLSNQGMVDALREKYDSYLNIEESVIDIKHEGKAFGYTAYLNFNKLQLINPFWLRDSN